MRRFLAPAARLVGLVSLLALAPPAWAELKAHRAQRAADLVQEALQREVYGLTGERSALLEEAAALAPGYAPAMWQRGFVRDSRQQWVRATDLIQARGQAERLERYERERLRHADTAASQLALADWCAKEGFAAQERAHLYRVLDLDPDHAAARSRLGFTRAAGRWISREDRAAREQQAAAQAEQLARWQPRIAELAAQLRRPSLAQQSAAAQALRDIRDPAAIAAIEAVFRNDQDRPALVAVEALAAIRDPEASLALARFAVLSPAPTVRELAAKKLGSRDLRSFAPQLLAEMHTPAQSQVVTAATPDGRIVNRHAFVREAQDQKELLVLDTEYVRANAGGRASDSRQTALRDAWLASLGRELGVAAQNEQTARLNERLAWVLNLATNQQLPADPQVWWQWWNEQNEVEQGEKSTATIYTRRVVSVIDQPVIASGSSGSQTPTMECLAAGTLVWTIRGPQPIEQIQAGDLVLAQDPDSGELAFQPVLRATRRPPAPLVRLHAAGETWDTTGGHLFWVAGDGWEKASGLAAGAVLHGLDGAVRLSQAEPGPQAATYNLVVDRFHTYFIGRAQVLTHDFTAAGAARTLAPGLRAP